MARVKFDKPPSLYWSEKTKIEHLERRIILYSILYYNHDVSIVSDFDYDDIQKQLYEMIKQFPDEFEKSRYYYCFYDFTGSTGYDIPYRLYPEDRKHLNLIAVMIKDAKENKRKK